MEVTEAFFSLRAADLFHVELDGASVPPLGCRRKVINMKSDRFNRSNIFGITKDNHFNAVCLVFTACCVHVLAVH